MSGTKAAAVTVTVAHNGDHMRGTAPWRYEEAARYLRDFMEAAGIEGGFTLIPKRASRWMGDPEPRVRVRDSDARSVKVVIKPSGNDSVVEYSLVCEGQQGWCVSQSLVRAIDDLKKGRTLKQHVANRIATPPPAPVVIVAPEPQPEPPKVVPYSASLVLQKVTLLHRDASRRGERQSRKAANQEERARMLERLAALDADDKRIEEEDAADDAARKADELLEVFGDLLG
jgi:hypothetical protein